MVTNKATTPMPRRLASIDGVVTIAPDETSKEKFWRRFAMRANPLAAGGLLFATLVIGGTTLWQQFGQADSVVRADRQNVALAGISAAFNEYDRASRAISAAEAAHYSAHPDAPDQFVTDAGQALDTSKENADAALLAAIWKTEGYPSSGQLATLQRTADRAHDAVATFFNMSISSQRPAAGQYVWEELNAKNATQALNTAMEDAWNVTGCDFGYPDGRDPQNCPVTPTPIPTIQVPEESQPPLVELP